MTSKLQVADIFGPTIQGEGPVIGQPSVFVRFGGCDYRCSWCDTLFAVLPEYKDKWQEMSPGRVMAEIEDRTGGVPILVSLSGGNPALYDLAPLIALGRERGYHFVLETQGSRVQDWFSHLDMLILSPKGPSSGMTTDWDILSECVDQPVPVALKVPVFNDEDYAFARAVSARYPDLPMYLQVGNDTVVGEANDSALKARFCWLADRVAEDKWFHVVVLTQLHVWAWGNEESR